MGASKGEKWASKYLLDPLVAPDPSQETGSGGHFASSGDGYPSVTLYPTLPTSASPSRSTFYQNNPYSSLHRQEALGAHDKSENKQLGSNSSTDRGEGPVRCRGSSLGERYPGDMSHRPLDLLRKHSEAAERSPHLNKKHIPGVDLIDSLDDTSPGLAYHHDGPYDATLRSRNTDYRSSPVAAVKETNAEALKATPREHIRDALDNHVPLQGTSVIPPGERDLSGRKMRYEEGADLMREDREGGTYKRWPGTEYHPHDLKGNGGPSVTTDGAAKERKNTKFHRRVSPDRNSEYEM